MRRVLISSKKVTEGDDEGGHAAILKAREALATGEASDQLKVSRCCAGNAGVAFCPFDLRVALRCFDCGVAGMASL